MYNIHNLVEDLRTLNPTKHVSILYADTAFPKITIFSYDDELVLPDDFGLFEDGKYLMISNISGNNGKGNFHYIKSQLDYQRLDTRATLLDKFKALSANLKAAYRQYQYDKDLKKSMPIIKKLLERTSETSVKPVIVGKDEPKRTIYNLQIMLDKLIALNPKLNIESNEENSNIVYYSNDGKIIVPKGFKIVQEDKSVNKFLLTNRLHSTGDNIYTCEIKCKKLK